MFTKEYSYGGSELYKNLLRITKFKRIVFGYFIFDEHDFYGKNENSSIINVMIFLYDEEDNIVGVNYRGIFYYYVYDTQGNVISIYDEYGRSSMSYQYDAWGRIRTIYDSGCPLYNVNPITYRGYYYDNDLGLYYLQSRYYNPELCRFISADGFDYINSYDYFGINAYIYCCNNPVYYNDPNGTKSKDGKGYFDLGYKGWKYRFENNQGGYKTKHGNRHIHLINKRLSKSYSQNEDGSPHDKNNNSPGSPPKKVKEELKKQTGWDWDAKQKSYNEKKKNSNSNNYNINFNFDFDFSNVGDVVVFAVLLSLLIVAVGTGIIFVLLFLEILPPIGIPA